METPPKGDLVVDEVERPSCVYLRCDKDRCQGRQIGLVSVSAGLKVVQLAISDACRGLVESVADFLPEARYQRSMVHFYHHDEIVRIADHYHVARGFTPSPALGP